MKNTIKYKYTGLVTLMVAMVFVISCDGVLPMAPDQTLATAGSGIPADQIQWVNWNQDVLDELAQNELRSSKTGTQSKNIHRDNGGSVGGNVTYNNEVDIPAYATNEESVEITVQVLSGTHQEQTLAGVDFLPNMQFESNVTITLNFDFLDCADAADCTDGDMNFIVYWSEDAGSTWYPITDLTVDYENFTITFEVDHFTRYAWAIG